MTNEKNLGPKPTNPRDISFDSSCFVQDGYITEWVVSIIAGSTGYPTRYSSEDEARKHGARTGGAVHAQKVPVMRRVSWTKVVK